MALVGIISVVVGIQHFMDTGHLDFMSIVFTAISVLYFVALVVQKEEKWKNLS